ncbi:bifunctional [glutamine synthetase] adenylyltransferase/[glutamine synthetase]-adenylyl-L-tyrosine phosphorylase [Sphingomonas sp. HDW15A]|uniref:bifunctional [glutamine synthetase] adenylyltransferase/[glutamine synthetase]-adenylyl-L-tyrosine phosphorylase n=1 Tax=Sphingomonas sp. HDW15A TaxID=2714942 RepID=UPI001408833B|nr:bifunctional [glutamine synthetase] adenylyltransferase/[glutamine synthetase]-adenylyl-L-tyrosine phosphorylase [Sphingomonas sp. HDW15A]QIK96575.1 bifunctional [glutamine synthetase] adenylyltransferase/[glutamine synthetase]-adenylyl-L-tyrosine phosphorylase [Sphingomonas sp. HDW15A]
MDDAASICARSDAIARATRHSPFLRDAIVKFPDVAERFLSEGAEAAVAQAIEIALDDEVAVRLRRQRTALALAVALGDLAGEFPLERLTGHLSTFADRAIHDALTAAVAERIEGAGIDGFTVLALGKLGSRELNYSSDVDLILLFDPDGLARRHREEAGESAVRIARRMVELLQQRTAEGYVARVDLRLRPSPEVTPIALPMGAAIAYYESQALPWERAAFIRARAAAGDQALGQRFLDEIQPFIWRRALDFGAIEEIRDISSRIRDHYAQGQAFGPGFDLKRGRGGIREAEFFTQVQQLIHGGRDSSLRAPAVLDALPLLVAAGRMEESQASGIANAYRRLRTVEHRIQMIDDQQTHRLPADANALEAVAALDGLSDGTALIDSLVSHVQVVAKAFDSLTPDRREGLSNDADILLGQLAEIGFEDPSSPARLIANWRSGQVRSLRSPAARTAFEAMLPVMLGAIARGPDPGRSLNRFADIVERLSSGINLYRLLEAQPRLAEILSLILAHAPALAEQLARRPGLIDGLIDASSFAAPPDPQAALELLKRRSGESYDEQLDRVRRTVGERRFALGVQLISRHRDPLDLTEGYAAIAQGAIGALAESATQEFQKVHGRIDGGELLILGLGRLGGMALTHASDLDLIFLYDGPQEVRSDGDKSLGPADYFNRLARRVVAALSVQTAAGPLYEVDTRLRPQGAQGMLAVHVDAFRDYQMREAWTWEHMALLRARPLYGSQSGRNKLLANIHEVLTTERDPSKIRSDAAAMRKEMAIHKPPSGPLDVKLGPGGLVDLEFVVHTLQLIHRTAFSPRLEEAIAILAEKGLIDEQADPDLRLLSRILVVSRLVTPGGGEPEEESRALVAEVCGKADWKTLVSEHDLARQRVRHRWERVRSE